MRPRFMNRGSTHPSRSPGGCLCASMRPRFMNRGSVQADANEAIEAEHASMRPRFMNRGSADRASRYRRQTAGFNEAPIHESGKCRRAAAQGRRNRAASMRPRFMNRGSLESKDICKRSSLASMRPRFMNRGSHRTVRWYVRCTDRLQ